MTLVTLVIEVEALAVDAVELAYPTRERLLERSDDEAIVVAHQTVRKTTPAVAITDEREKLEPSQTVRVVREDLLALVAPRRYVEQPSRELDTKGTRHSPSLRIRSHASNRPNTTVPVRVAPKT